MKKTIKTFIGSNTSRFNYPIIVNSYGRSGSTVLTKSIINNAIKPQSEVLKDISFRSMSQSAWNLGNIKLNKGIVYKTHDYPPENNFEYDIRMLYTFADPVEVVLSLIRLYDERGEEWIKEHYDHLGATYGNFDDIITKDQLRLKQHLNSWLIENRFPIAFIKYEKMWDHQDEISEFLGFEVNLPPFRKRKSKKNDDQKLRAQLENTYASLREKVKSLDGFFTN